MTRLDKELDPDSGKRSNTTYGFVSRSLCLPAARGRRSQSLCVPYERAACMVGIVQQTSDTTLEYTFPIIFFFLWAPSLLASLPLCSLPPMCSLHLCSLSPHLLLFSWSSCVFLWRHIIYFFSIFFPFLTFSAHYYILQQCLLFYLPLFPTSISHFSTIYVAKFNLSNIWLSGFRKINI